MSAGSDAHFLVEEEFEGLRAEILQRAAFQQQLVNIAIIGAGTLLTLFFQYKDTESWLLLTYPPLALFLAIEWSFNNARIGQIGFYIREEIETAFRKGLGWEHWLLKATASSRSKWMTGKYFAYGIFIVVPLTTMAAALQRFKWSISEDISLIADLAIVLCFIPCVIRASEK